MIEIKTDRLILTPLGMKYLAEVNEYAMDIENTRYMMFLPNDSVEETIEFLESVDRDWASENQMNFELAILFEGEMVGAISITLEEENPQSAEFGWIINKRYWRKGIASEAALALMKYAKENMGVTHFYAHCDTENPGSYKTMEKIGMVRTDEYGGRKNKNSDEERREYQYEINLMEFVWRDYNPETMDFVESWLDDSAIENTGLDEGFRDFYEYWLNEDGFVIGENYWCKVVYEKDTPFAVVAISLYENSYLIMEMVVAPHLRGQGKGTKLLKELLANKEILGMGIHKCEAEIYPSNIASKKAFENAGFIYTCTHGDESGKSMTYTYVRE